MCIDCNYDNNLPGQILGVLNGCIGGFGSLFSRSSRRDPSMKFFASCPLATVLRNQTACNTTDYIDKSYDVLPTITTTMTSKRRSKHRHVTRESGNGFTLSLTFQKSVSRDFDDIPTKNVLFPIVQKTHFFFSKSKEKEE